MGPHIALGLYGAIGSTDAVSYGVLAQRSSLLSTLAKRGECIFSREEPLYLRLLLRVGALRVAVQGVARQRSPAASE
jgi:hypothetical protein